MNELANYLDRLITALERLADAADRDRPRVLDPDGAAKLMGVGVTRVMALARMGELPSYREGHGTRFLSSDVAHYYPLAHTDWLTAASTERIAWRRLEAAMQLPQEQLVDRGWAVIPATAHISGETPEEDQS